VAQGEGPEFKSQYCKKKITGEFIPKRRIVLTQLSHNDITVISSGGPHLFRDEKLKNSI
jgi:hypothetical protein